MIRILIADDHDILRAGLRHILADSPDIEVAAEATNGSEAIAQLRKDLCDVLVLDLTMPGRNGIELIKQIRSDFPRLPLLILSMHKEDIYAVRALKAGANGYLCKDNAEAFLAEAIRKVHAGGLFINQSVAERLTMNILQGRHAEMPHNRLTDREYQVFLLIVQGMGVTEIGRHLNLSVKTVSTHKASIQVKMDLANTAELVRYAVENNLIDSNAAAAK
ncbi:MAG TPA: response regulator transcription factor [Rhodocyclaceae bacterium]|jgi:two-component system, NarL family, invasion response regulator UvrY|nr:response regulator transcription factor [Rhodocyclaceae bacterium]